MSEEGDREGRGFSMTPITRRDFLKTVAVAGIAVSAVGSLAGCGSSGTSASSGASMAPLVPKKGGNLRVGIGGGSTKETIDAHLMYGYPDQARCDALYDLSL